MSSQVSTCKICQAKSNFIFVSLIRKKYSVNFYQCTECGFVQPEEPFWLDEAYSKSMNLGDTGQVVRSLSARNVVVSLVFLWFDKFAKYLDFASGYGFFVRLMRDVGLDYYWSDKYTENLLAIGFDGDPEDSRFELVTIFECFEHWTNPVEEIEALLKCTSSILFTTNTVSIPAPQPGDWWYYGLDHGQHIAFYSKKSLKFLASKYGLNFYSKNGYHLLTDKKINSTLFKIIVILSVSGRLNFLTRYFKSKTRSDSDFLISN